VKASSGLPSLPSGGDTEILLKPCQNRADAPVDRFILQGSAGRPETQAKRGGACPVGDPFTRVHIEELERLELRTRRSANRLRHGSDRQGIGHQKGEVPFNGRVLRQGPVRDRGLLESALAMPRASFSGQFVHEDLPAMAGAHFYHLCKNHPFMDGNKRVALMCCGAFLRMNGWDLVSEGDAAADAILDLVSGVLDKEGFAAWLRANCRERPSFELRDFMAQCSLLSMRDLAAAIVASGSQPEVDATSNEAAQAIPLIAELEGHADACTERGDERLAHGLRQASAVLVTMYRLAEDMGYEW